MSRRRHGRREKAEPLYRRALAIDEASYGPDHPSTATVRENLAALEAARR
ncbi:MAG: tetratricopeptide repeat protein [Roseiarcus sp.]